MKQLLFVLLLALGSNLYSQDYKLSNYYEGYIIKKDGSRERGYILYDDESKRYEQVIFKKELKGKREKYKPKDIAGYKVADQLYHAVQFKDIPFKNTKFLALEKDGCLRMYSYRILADGSWSSSMILENDEQAVNVQTFILSFANKMAEMVKDDAALAEKIRNKEKGYSLLAIEAIVDEYNANCNS